MYFSYLASGIVESCKEAYDSALKVSDALPATHPIKLGLALNFSVYYYEIKNDGASACHLAQKVCLVSLLVILMSAVLSWNHSAF